jgi:predicted MPP superfamily phosphohydrolase
MIFASIAFNESESDEPPALIAAGIMTAAAASIPFADAEATNWVRVNRLPLLVPDLPPALTGATIAQVSDLHLFERELHPAARHALEALHRERPDLLVLTGDQWDRRAGAHALEQWLQGLPRGVPVVAVLGNHEYSAGTSVERARRIHDRGGAELLVNSSTSLSIRGGRIQLAGLDDMRYGKTDAAAAARNLDPDVPQIWLLHEPGQLDRAAWPAGPLPLLTLAGHTHGGQIRCPGVPPILPQGSGRYLAGFYQTRRGSFYVSRGVGAATPRMRVLCPAELPIFELRPAPARELTSMPPDVLPAIAQ